MNNTDNSVIRVLIADDHLTFVEGMSTLLAKTTDLECIGIAIDGNEAVALSLELKPDVVVMDVCMPKINGIEATKRIKSDLPNTMILMLSAYGYEPYVLSAMEAGATGYLLKNVSLRELMNAIRSLSVGETVLDNQGAPEGNSFLAG